MLTERIPINPPGSEDGQAFLQTYVLAGERLRPGVIICPGGAYTLVSPRESEPVALQFCAAGFHVFVLTYTVRPKYYRQPLLELSAAVTEVRKRAKEWNLDPNRIAVAGFSAGGHLAASLGVHWYKLPDAPQNEPQALILSYPVITSGPFKHPGSFDNLLGPNPSAEILEEMRLDRQVTSKTPPTFLWHTVADEVVPVENSLLFANALRQNQVPFEMHLFPDGIHGLSLATAETDSGGKNNPHAARWLPLCIEWLKGLFDFG